MGGNGFSKTLILHNCFSSYFIRDFDLITICTKPNIYRIQMMSETKKITPNINEQLWFRSHHSQKRRKLTVNQTLSNKTLITFKLNTKFHHLYCNKTCKMFQAMIFSLIQECKPML